MFALLLHSIWDFNPCTPGIYILLRFLRAQNLDMRLYGVLPFALPRLANANKLIDGLGGEKDRWSATVGPSESEIFSDS